jgi:hypothetical protein
MRITLTAMLMMLLVGLAKADVSAPNVKGGWIELCRVRLETARGELAKWPELSFLGEVRILANDEEVILSTFDSEKKWRGLCNPGAEISVRSGRGRAGRWREHRGIKNFEDGGICQFTPYYTAARQSKRRAASITLQPVGLGNVPKAAASLIRRAVDECLTLGE